MCWFSHTLDVRRVEHVKQAIVTCVRAQVTCPMVWAWADLVGELSLCEG